MFRIALTSFAALLLVISAGRASPAQPAVTYGELSQEQRIGYIEALLARGDFRQAQIFLSNSRFNEGDTGYRAAFAQAIILKRTKRLAEAETLLRKILDERPAYDVVRLELAQVLAMRGNRTAAAYHLQMLADAAPDRSTRDRFESFIDQINPEKPFTFGGFISIAPSSNVNSGAGGKTILVNGIPFTINPSGRAQSGLGVRGGVNAAFTHRLSERLSAYVAGSAVISEYAGSRFDTVTGDLRAGLRYQDSARLLGAELITDRRWIDLKPFDYGVGGRIFARQPLAPRILLSGEMQYVKRVYDVDAGADLKTFSTMARLSYAAAPGRSVYVQAGFTVEDAVFRPHNSYKGGYVEIGGAALLPFGVNGQLALRAGVNGYDARFPGSPAARRDEFYEARASFVKRDLSYAGFTPRLTVSYYHQKSNVALYDYDKYGADITFTREF